MDLQCFSALSGMDLGAFAAKPTSLSGDQQEASETLWTSPGGELTIGLWECSPGRFTADRSKAAEFCYFLSGQIRMTHLDGSQKILGPGDALMLPKGWKGEWEILEQTRKIFVFFEG